MYIIRIVFFLNLKYIRLLKNILVIENKEYQNRNNLVNYFTIIHFFGFPD